MEQLCVSGSSFETNSWCCVLMQKENTALHELEEPDLLNNLYEKSGCDYCSYRIPTGIDIFVL
jgi:hypothetical protein